MIKAITIIVTLTFALIINPLLIKNKRVISATPAKLFMGGGNEMKLIHEYSNYPDFTEENEIQTALIYEWQSTEDKDAIIGLLTKNKSDRINIKE